MLKPLEGLQKWGHVLLQLLLGFIFAMHGAQKFFGPSFYGLPLGALDDDPGVKPKRHVFVAHKAPWYDITDDLPQFPELPTKAP